MNSAFLNKVGLGNFDLGYLVIFAAVITVIMIVLLVFLIILISKVKILKNRLDKLVLGKDGLSLEEEIKELIEDNKYLKETADKNLKNIRNLYKRLESAYQKIGLVKYDAFNQMGGQLSFSLALLDENNNGFIINSVHSTEGCYSYTKEIKNGVSAISLGKEEAEALAIAIGE
ncbi:MAG: DUF4446 family protein [Acetatifactor sp.]